MDNLNIFVILTTIFISLCVGSFLNVLFERSIHIFQIKKPFKSWSFIVTPTSHCPHCKKSIRPIDNIPVISYLFLRGKCFFCSKKISLQYPTIEALTALLFLLALFKFSLTLEFFLACLIISMLIWASLIDLKFFILPNELTFSLLALGLIANFYDVFIDFYDALGGAFFGYFSLWIIYKIHFLIKKRHGMGFGDFKLFAALGAFFGWQALPLIGILGSLGGLVLYLIYYLRDRANLKNMIPFGPFLSMGGITYLLFFY